VSTRDLILDYFRCLDEEDWDGMRALWHPDDCRLRAVGARPREGREQVLEFFGKLFTPWKLHEDRPTRLVVCADTVTAEVLFLGTTHDGLEVSFEAVDVFDLSDGLISRLSNWYDIAYARKVLAGAG
jgi:ketosteroid isomerase-like protein